MKSMRPQTTRNQTPSPGYRARSAGSGETWKLTPPVRVCSGAESGPNLCDPMGCSPPLSMEFSRQECRSELPFPPREDIPGPGIKLPALADGFFTTN